MTHANDQCMQSTTFTRTKLAVLWRDISGTEEMLPRCIIPLLAKGFNNLPLFLYEFCFYYYVQGMTMQQVAAALGIGEHLAKQRRVVSISLFRILLACKPKNPV